MSPIDVSRSLKTISQPCAFVQQMPSRPFGMSGIMPGWFILPLLSSIFLHYHPHLAFSSLLSLPSPPRFHIRVSILRGLAVSWWCFSLLGFRLCQLPVYALGNFVKKFGYEREEEGGKEFC